jgi:hypothetical protein
MAAYTRRSYPQPPMIRYMGNSRASKNTKNSSRSRARKDPIMAVSRTSREIMYVLTWRSILHDARTAAGIRNVVSRTIHRLIPSTPRMYWKFSDPTQVACSTRWNPAPPG